MLADPAFREAVCEAMDVISADVQLEPDGEGFTLVIDQLQKTDDLPGFARTFAGDSTQAIQREEWPSPTGQPAHRGARQADQHRPGRSAGAVRRGDHRGRRAGDQGQGAADRRQAGEADGREGHGTAWTLEQRLGQPTWPKGALSGTQLLPRPGLRRPVADVDAMLMDPAFRERVCDAQGAIRKTVAITEEDGGVIVVVDQVQTGRGHPRLRQEVRRRRDQPRADRVVVRRRERPGRGRHPGQARRDDRDHQPLRVGGVTTERLEMTIKVNIPLVGGKIESLIADLLRKALKAENAVGRDYLAG